MNLYSFYNGADRIRRLMKVIRTCKDGWKDIKTIKWQ